MCRRFSRLGGAILIVAFSHTSLPARAQSLVEVAQLAREMRERQNPPTKVYTNADLPHVEPVSTPSESGAPSVSDYQSQLDAALERERALLERLRRRQVWRPVPVVVEARAKPRPPDPPPTQTTPGIPLYLAYGGSSTIVATPRKSRPREANVDVDRPSRHRRRSSRLDRRSQIRPTESHTNVSPTLKPTTRRPPARNGYEQSARPFPYIAPGLPAPGQRPSAPGNRTSGRGRNVPRGPLPEITPGRH